MILVNGKKLSEKVLEELTKEFKKNFKENLDGSYTFMYADGYYSKDKQGDIVAPPSMSVQLHSKVVGEKSLSVSARYCNSYTEKNGVFTYDIEHHTIKLEENVTNIEMLVWFYNYSPNFVGGLIKDGKKMVKVEQKHKVAETKASNRKLEGAFIHRLYTELSEKDIINIAESMSISTKDIDQNQIKTTIEGIVLADKTGKARDKFLSKTESNAIATKITPLVRLKRAEDEKVITFKEKKWYLGEISDDNKIIGVMAGADKYEILYRHLKENDQDKMDHIFNTYDQVIADKD